MSRQTLDAFSMFPYFTKANAKSEKQKRLQGLLYALKDGRQVTDGTGKHQDATEWFADLVRDAMGKHVPSEFLGKDVFVVPMPSSAVTPTPPSRGAWPMFDVAMRWAEAKVVAGAGPVLVRNSAVQKSHAVSADKRASVETHATSLSVDLKMVPKGCAITILDDVVSSGTNVMGAMVALRRGGFTPEVRVMTATHTVGADYGGQDVVSAKSLIVWLEGQKERAWRPSEDIEFVNWK
ncbi:MAG: hypothetical protein HYZ28_21195 [Myxococcales bacterium]|nr:hypothetical protein [Myxococcales bacterium]